ncbi:MAG: hypothetical protein MUF81_16615 [Verrucomicrobia bacterium]|jgi:hypothetical protein|nr:hypothetical protein [Verrucomicrobiota bacterium]
MRSKPFKLNPALLVLAVALTARLWAQTNETPARLAIIPESETFSAVADLLTVELSAKPQLAELEAHMTRTELEEARQSLSKLAQHLAQVSENLRDASPQSQP